MSLNYNITLLKTIKDPLFEAFDLIDQDLQGVIASQKAPADLLVNNIDSIFGSLQMIGRPSLVVVSKTIKEAIEKIKDSQRWGWDHIRVSEVSTTTRDLLKKLKEHLKTLEKGDQELSVHLWKQWSDLAESINSNSNNINALYDPSPKGNPDQFSALELTALREVSSAHIQKFVSAFSKLENTSDLNVWGDELSKIGEVFDWAYALKHRFGYHFFWLACRARITFEFARLSDLSTEDRKEIIDTMKLVHSELKKFSEDARKPRPETVQMVMRPMLNEFPDDWEGRYRVLQELKEVYSLEEFWKSKKQIQEEKFHSSSVNIESLQEGVRLLKASWTDIQSSGTHAQQFKRSLTTFIPKFEMYPNPGQDPLLKGLHELMHRFAAMDKDGISSDISKETATFLLLVEESIERQNKWPLDFNDRSELAFKRLLAALYDQKEKLVLLPSVTWDQGRLRQKSQEAISQVAREVLADLTVIEEVFDEYFRGDAEDARLRADSIRTKMLTSVAVLRALHQNSAAQVMDAINTTAQILKKAAPPENFKQEYGTLTICLTGLSTFLEAFEKGDDDAIRLLKPALAHLGLQESNISDKKMQDFTGGLLLPEKSEILIENEKSFEHDPSAVIEQVSVEETDEEENALSYDDVDKILEDFSEDQPEDQEESNHSEVPLSSPQEDFPYNSSLMPSQETLDEERRLATEAFKNKHIWVDRVIDEEIAEAFFEEVVEVLSEVSALQVSLSALPDQKDMLIELRRQFHTLKGSGRTTQLWGVGQIAAVIEERLNEVISSEQEYSQGIHQLVEYGFDLQQRAMTSLTHGDRSFEITSSMWQELDDLLEQSREQHHAEDDLVEEAALVVPDFEDLSEDAPTDSPKIIDVTEAEAEADEEHAPIEEDSILEVIENDLHVHINNLNDLVLSGLNVHNLHWSAHTLAALARELENDDYARMCVVVERKADGIIQEDRTITEYEDTWLIEAAQSLLEKAEFLLGDITQTVELTQYDEQIMQALEDVASTDIEETEHEEQPPQSHEQSVEDAPAIPVNNQATSDDINDDIDDDIWSDDQSEDSTEFEEQPSQSNEPPKEDVSSDIATSVIEEAPENISSVEEARLEEETRHLLEQIASDRSSASDEDASDADNISIDDAFEVSIESDDDSVSINDDAVVIANSIDVEEGNEESEEQDEEIVQNSEHNIAPVVVDDTPQIDVAAVQDDQDEVWADIHQTIGSIAEQMERLQELFVVLSEKQKNK